MDARDKLKRSAAEQIRVAYQDLESLPVEDLTFHILAQEWLSKWDFAFHQAQSLGGHLLHNNIVRFTRGYENASTELLDAVRESILDLLGTAISDLDKEVSVGTTAEYRRIRSLKMHDIFHIPLSIEVDQSLCFVLMPFAADFDEVREDVIDVAIRDVGLVPLRADDIYGPGNIMDDIWKHILKAKVIIADLTGRNANVFYELGLAHAMEKQVIMIAQDIADIPFDLRQLRQRIYAHTGRGLAALKEELKQDLRIVIDASTA
jgi:hypothetical protein